MKKSSRLLSLVLSAIMVLSILPVIPLTASAAISGTCGDNVTWQYNTETATLTISGTGAMKDYDCDDYNDTYVTTAPWRSYYETMRTVVINSGVTSIGERAFYYCKGLTSITIPDSVTSIGDDAFYNCTGLTSVTIGNSVTSIGGWSFYGCGGLTSVVIPDSVTSIGWAAFEDCSGLTSVTIGNSVTSIGKRAFSGTAWYNNQPEGLVYAGKVAYSYKGTCPASVTINEGTLGIADYAFHYCTELTSVTIGNSVTSIGDDAFSGCSKLTSVVIPDSVTSIGWAAFEDCSGLTSVTIGNSVTSIGRSAFYGCTGLASIIIPDSVTSIGRSAFYETVWYKNQPDGLIYAGKVVCDYKGDCPESVILKDGTLSIGESAFSECTNLKSIVIPDSVTVIGSYAFHYCTGLENVCIPNSVTKMEDGVFHWCTGLKSVTIYGSIKSIGRDMFDGCFKLTAITIPESVELIDEWAFYDCNGLRSISIPAGVTSIAFSAFSACNGLESITVDSANPVYHSSGNCLIETESKTLVSGCEKSIIPSDGSVEAIGDCAFLGIKTLTDINIPDSIISIGSNAFVRCNGLTSITIPDSVESMDKYVFCECRNLRSVKIGNGITSISSQMFAECDWLTSISIGSGVKSIDIGAFGICPKLESITVDSENTVYHSANNCLIKTESKELFLGCKSSVIPNDGSVTSIGNNAFSSCSGLTSIVIPDSVTSIGDYAFGLCSGLTSVTIPDSVTSIDDYAFYDCTNLKDVYYDGTQQQKESINIGDDNKNLVNATWHYKEAETYNITYNLNGGKNNSGNPKSYVVGEKTITLKNPTKKGYTFAGWYKGATKITKIAAGSTGNITLTAKWTANKYTIAFVGNGSTSGATKSITATYDKAVTLTANGFKRTGYTFKGWNTKKDGKGKAYKNKASVKNLTATANGKITLYAQWTKVTYKINYKLNSGKNNAKNPKTYTVTSAISLKNPTRKGYKFKGWYSDSKFKKRVTKIVKGSTGNKTLYAKWAKK